jgi:protein-disulfide isomerase
MRQRLRLRRLQLIAALFLLLLAGSTVLAVFRGSTKASTPRQATSVAAIPEHGMALGSARAPATLVEFADPQCPYCAQYARQALPGLIDHWVRPGRLRLELRLLTFIGPDSKSAARLIAAAGLQDRAWPLSELAFLTQRRENSGYVTAGYLRRLARATPGLDAGTALAQRGSTRVEVSLRRARQEARRLGVHATPSFYVVRPGRPPERVQPGSFTYNGVAAALRSALQR